MSREEESITSRDINGLLVRLDEATDEQLKEEVAIVIDGHVVLVKKAVPALDAQGQPIYGRNGLVKPRPTTIYDAADALTDATPELDAQGVQMKDESGRPIFRALPPEKERAPKDSRERGNPIPVLCHQNHLEPVAVCRACVVEISVLKKDRRTGNLERRTAERLLPACQHRVGSPDEKMEVRTLASTVLKSKTRIEAAVKTVVGLLMDDHPSPCAKEDRRRGSCELEKLAADFKLNGHRPPIRPQLSRDTSSPLIDVDHNACILCDRCIRSCDAVKHNYVIGRMNKGYRSRIAFDLNAPMGSSSCVSCGECMVSCPTGALTFKEANFDDKYWKNRQPPARVVDILEELRLSRILEKRADGPQEPGHEAR